MKKIIIILFFNINIFGFEIAPIVKLGAISSISTFNSNINKNKQMNNIEGSIGFTFESGTRYFAPSIPIDLYLETNAGFDLIYNNKIFDKKNNDIFYNFYYSLNEKVKLINSDTSIDIDFNNLKNYDRNYDEFNFSTVDTFETNFFGNLHLSLKYPNIKKLYLFINLKFGANILLENYDYLVIHKLVEKALNNSKFDNEYSEIEKNTIIENLENQILNKFAEEYQKERVRPFYQIGGGVKYYNFIFELYGGNITKILGLKLGYEFLF